MTTFRKNKQFTFVSFAITCCVIVFASVIWFGISDVKYVSENRVYAANNEGFNIGQHPPNFSAQDLNGQWHTLDQYQGEIVVLHFWASWCPYCRGEIPKLVKIYREMTEQGVAILSVSVDDDLNKLSDFVKREKLPYTVIPDRASRPLLSEQYRIPGIPVTFILASDGRIIGRFVGASNLIDVVNKAIKLDL